MFFPCPTCCGPKNFIILICDISALAAPRTDLWKVWYPLCLYEVRWLCIGCAEVRSLKCVSSMVSFWNGSASAAPRIDRLLYLPYYGNFPLMTDPKMCSQHSWDSEWTGIGCAEDGSHFRKLNQPKYKNKVRINQCRLCRRLNLIVHWLIEKQFVDQQSAVPRSGLSRIKE